VSFDGRAVLVTGGTRGIGKAIALRFAALGAKTIALGYLRNDSAAEAAAEELRAAGAEPVLVRGNIASDRVVTEFASHGPYDAVVHNAATGVIRSALETEDKHWDWTLNANARALLALARACAPDMKPGSSFVGVSSLGSTRVLENYILVGTSKAALESVVRYLAVELAPRGIRVVSLAPTFVATVMTAPFLATEQDEILQRIPLGRLATLEDVAAAAVFAATASAMTGCSLRIDGGWTAQ
jgi:enoyl-[acyl-carrier protein] reductase III